MAPVRAPASRVGTAAGSAATAVAQAADATADTAAASAAGGANAAGALGAHKATAAVDPAPGRRRARHHAHHRRARQARRAHGRARRRREGTGAGARGARVLDGAAAAGVARGRACERAAEEIAAPAQPPIHRDDRLEPLRSTRVPGAAAGEARARGVRRDGVLHARGVDARVDAQLRLVPRPPRRHAEHAPPAARRGARIEQSRAAAVAAPQRARADAVAVRRDAAEMAPRCRVGRRRDTDRRPSRCAAASRPPHCAPRRSPPSSKAPPTRRACSELSRRGARVGSRFARTGRAPRSPATASGLWRRSSRTSTSTRRPVPTPTRGCGTTRRCPRTRS